MPDLAMSVVHGVGAHKQGEFLQAVVEPLASFPRNQFEGVRVASQLRPEHGPATSRLDFLDEHWYVREVGSERSIRRRPNVCTGGASASSGSTYGASSRARFPSCAGNGRKGSKRTRSTAGTPWAGRGPGRRWNRRLRALAPNQPLAGRRAVQGAVA